jgi:hypothetical protein
MISPKINRLSNKSTLITYAKIIAISLIVRGVGA